MPRRRSSTARNGPATRGNASGQGAARRDEKTTPPPQDQIATGSPRSQDTGVDLVMSALPGISEAELDALRRLLGDDLTSLVKGR